MKKHLLGLLLSLLFAPIYSQSLETVEMQIQDLEEAKQYLQSQVKEINIQIKDIDSQLGELHRQVHELNVEVAGDGHRASSIAATKLYDQPSGGTVKANVPGKTSLVIDERDQNRYKTTFNGMVGYVPTYQIKFENPESENILNEEQVDEIIERVDKRTAEHNRQVEEIERQRQLEAQQRREQMQRTAAAAKKEKDQRIRAKYNSSDAERILSHRIWLGMTKEMLIDSWGQPSSDNINRSVGSWGVHEQWVYGNQYVYLENGIVTSWQD